ncbi:MAG: hypothetical protein ABIP48_22560 [Planctomycetota bacterium]
MARNRWPGPIFIKMARHDGLEGILQADDTYRFDVNLGIAAAGENLRLLLPCRLDHAKIEEHANSVHVEQL